MNCGGLAVLPSYTLSSARDVHPLLLFVFHHSFHPMLPCHRRFVACCHRPCRLSWPPELRCSVSTIGASLSLAPLFASPLPSPPSPPCPALPCLSAPLHPPFPFLNFALSVQYSTVLYLRTVAHLPPPSRSDFSPTIELNSTRLNSTPLHRQPPTRRPWTYTPLPAYLFCRVSTNDFTPRSSSPITHPPIRPKPQGNCSSSLPFACSKPFLSL